jgi:hypothetical protein
MEGAMTSDSENRDTPWRLQAAIEAVSKDLDAIEQRPHLYLRHTVEALGADEAPRGLGTFVDQFALALQRSNST